MATTADKLKRLLEQRQITPYRVAKETQVSETAVHDWLNGKYEPRVIYLKILADYFGVPITYFIE